MPKRDKTWNKGQGRGRQDDERRGDQSRREDRQQPRRQQSRQGRDDRSRSRSPPMPRRDDRSRSANKDIDRLEYLKREMQRTLDHMRSHSTETVRTSRRSSTTGRTSSVASKKSSRSTLTERSAAPLRTPSTRRVARTSRSPVRSRQPRSPVKGLKRQRAASQITVADKRVKREPRVLTGLRYRSPERPSFIPDPTAPIAMPKRLNDIAALKALFQTHGTERTQVNPVHMFLKAGKDFMADVYNFGFISLNVYNKETVLVMCSPSGHVLIFTKTGPLLQIPFEVRDILYKIKDVRKVALYKDSVERFLNDNGMEAIPDLVDLHPIAKKAIPSIMFGVQNFFKSQLGKDYITRGSFDADSDEHVKQAAHLTRTVSYGVWFTAVSFATAAGLGTNANLSSFLRYTLFFEDADKYERLIADPYYVPYEDIVLKPLDQHLLETETARMQTVLRACFKNYRFRPVEPFSPVPPDTKCCKSCGVFFSNTTDHNCIVKPTCVYPCCLNKRPHTIVTCQYVKAWCNICQRRGHVDRQHPEDQKLPVCYFWDIFLKFSRLNMDTAYVHKGEKCHNPYFHQMGLYGLPPSKLPKVAPETGVGKDLPDDPRFSRQATTAASSATASRRPSLPVKIDLSKLNRANVSRVEKSLTKPITLNSLTEAIKLATKISHGSEQGSSGTQRQIRDPVVSKLLELVKDVKQGDVKSTAVPDAPTVPAVTPEVKLSRRQRKLAKVNIKRDDVDKYASLYKSLYGFSPNRVQPVIEPELTNPPPPVIPTIRSERVENEELLLASDNDDDDIPLNETPVNLSPTLLDFETEMDFEVTGSNEVATLAETVQQVVIQDQAPVDQTSDQPDPQV